MKKNQIVFLVLLLAAVLLHTSGFSQNCGDCGTCASPCGAGQEVKKTPISGETVEKSAGDSLVKPAVPVLQQKAVQLPRLVDLGRGTCIPCKMMTPVLESLKKKYADRVIVDYIDLGKEPDMAGKYKVRAIPTQILFDASGKEVYRHEGFIPETELVKKFAEIGVK